MFGVAYKRYFDRFGMDGHNGLDYYFPDDPDRGYGRPIKACHDGKVVRVVYDNGFKSQGTAVYIQTQNEPEIILTVYMHLSDIRIKLGDIIKVGTTIGLAGNSGYVSPKPTIHSPHAGTHLHLLMQKWINGRWVAIDPTPLLFKEGDKLPIKFTKFLGLGSTGDQVSWLQTCLKLSGFAKDYEPISYFGFKTMRDVRKLQAKLGLTPVGFVGPKTRAHLNIKFS